MPAGSSAMTRHDEDIEMTARLYECRTAARSILGAGFDSTLEPWRAVIAARMQAQHCSVLQAVIDLGAPLVDGLALMLLMAAAVELIEQPASVEAGDSHGTQGSRRLDHASKELPGDDG